MSIRSWTMRLVGVSVLALGVAGAAQADSTNPLPDKVRAADSRFEDVAVAKAEGYAPIPCAALPAAPWASTTSMPLI